MRFLVKFTLPVEAANAAIKAGTLPKTLGTILEEMKPEAAYFTTMDGHRTGLVFCDLPDPSRIPAMAEPFYLAFEARVEFYPVMSVDDMKKAVPTFEQTAQKYG